MSPDIRRHGVVVAALFSLLGAPLAGGEPCRLGPVERELVEEILRNGLRDAIFVAVETEVFPPAQRAFALSLIGTDEGSRGVLVLDDACSGPETFDPVCSFPPFEDPVPPFWETRDRCVQRACQSTDTDSVEVYLTKKPRTSPDDPHAFSYTSDRLQSEIIYDPNPHITWSFDSDFSVEPFRTRGEATASHRVRVLPQGLAPLLLDHELKATVSGVADPEVLFVRLEVLFPQLGKGHKPLRAEASVDDLGVTDGTVSIGRKRLATISGEFSGGEFEEFRWEGTCGASEPFLRGDVTGNGSRNQGDVRRLMAHLFKRTPIPCEDAADVDDNGRLDTGDPVYLANWLLDDGPPPLPPSDEPGPDPTDDSLTCVR